MVAKEQEATGHLWKADRDGLHVCSFLCALRALCVDAVTAADAVDCHCYGSANATMLPPDGAPFLPPPHTMTTYCRPFTM